MRGYTLSGKQMHDEMILDATTGPTVPEMILDALALSHAQMQWNVSSVLLTEMLDVENLEIRNNRKL